jgi:hypothetical protein
MASNLTNVNSQMQQLADNSIVATKEKFGVSLDFTENSLKQFEILLQQAHERYKQVSSIGISSNIPIESTVQAWGSYLGEVIRRSFKGDWIVDQKNVFLQIDSQRLNPLGQVRSRIVYGPQYNIITFYQGIKSQYIQKESPTGKILDKKESQALSIEKGTKIRRTIYIAGLIGALIIVCLCFLSVWVLSALTHIPNWYMLIAIPILLLFIVMIGFILRAIVEWIDMRITLAREERESRAKLMKSMNTITSDLTAVASYFSSSPSPHK